MSDESHIKAVGAGLERLRGFRNWRVPNLDLSATIGREAKALQRLKRNLGGAGQAWIQVVPEELAARASLEGVRRGVLTVRAHDASARYELDRFLRSGGEREVIRASHAPIRSVRVVG